MDKCYEYIDYLSLHKYFGFYNDDDPSELDNYLGKNIEMDKFIKEVVEMCDKVGAEKKTDKKINLSFDE